MTMKTTTILVLDLSDEELAVLGIVPEDIGTHSWRKGGATFLLGILDGPNPIAVYIRMGWSIGNTQDRYIAGGGGSDPYCARLSAGLSMTTKEGTVLPPHFNNEALDYIAEHGGWASFFCDYAAYPSGLQKCIPICPQF